MPGRSSTASDIEQPQENLADHTEYLEPDRLGAVIETNLDPLADERTVVNGGKRDLIFEVAIERRNAFAVSWINGDAATAHRTQGRCGQGFQALWHFADNACRGRPPIPMDGNDVNAAR